MAAKKVIAHGHWEQGFMQRSNSSKMETHNVWIQKWSEFQRWWKNKLQYLPDVFVHWNHLIIFPEWTVAMLKPVTSLPPLRFWKILVEASRNSSTVSTGKKKIKWGNLEVFVHFHGHWILNVITSYNFITILKRAYSPKSCNIPIFLSCSSWTR